MDLNEELQAHFLLYNNSPLEDFCGLSPVQMQRLLHHTYSADSPVRIRQQLSSDTMDQVGLFRVVENLLQVVNREKEVKLTATGALPPRIVKELYGKGFLKDYAIEKGVTKLMKEADCTFIIASRLLLEIGGVLKKRKNILSLTKKGNQFLEITNRLEFFMHFIQTYTQRFRWAFFDYFTELPVGQMGWAFTVFLLLKYGNVERETCFYSEKYKTAYPFLFNDMMEDPEVSDESYFESCYSHRSFSDFLSWFSLVELRNVSSGDYFAQKRYVIPSDLFDKIFEMNE